MGHARQRLDGCLGESGHCRCRWWICLRYWSFVRFNLAWITSCGPMCGIVGPTTREATHKHEIRILVGKASESPFWTASKKTMLAHTHTRNFYMHKHKYLCTIMLLRWRDHFYHCVFFRIPCRCYTVSVDGCVSFALCTRCNHVGQKARNRSRAARAVTKPAA